MPRAEGEMKRRFRSVEEIERVFFPRLWRERCRSERLARELQECDEALTACEGAHIGPDIVQRQKEAWKRINEKERFDAKG